MRTILKALLLILLTLNFACGDSASTSDGTTESATTESTAMEESPDAEDDEEEEDKSNRPSPPRTATGTIGDVSITIDYSSPSVKGRTIWGGLVPYGKIWRTGANEATTFEVSSDVTVEGQKLAAGKYALFTIPGEDKWTVIFNSEPEQWGSYDHDPSKDVLSVEVTPTPMEESVEAMEFTIEGDEVVLKWEKLAVPFKVAAAG